MSHVTQCRAFLLRLIGRLILSNFWGMAHFFTDLRLRVLRTFPMRFVEHSCTGLFLEIISYRADVLVERANMSAVIAVKSLSGVQRRAWHLAYEAGNHKPNNPPESKNPTLQNPTKQKIQRCKTPKTKNPRLQNRKNKKSKRAKPPKTEIRRPIEATHSVLPTINGGPSCSRNVSGDQPLLQLMAAFEFQRPDDAKLFRNALAEAGFCSVRDAVGPIPGDAGVRHNWACAPRAC